MLAEKNGGSRFFGTSKNPKKESVMRKNGTWKKKMSFQTDFFGTDKKKRNFQSWNGRCPFRKGLGFFLQA